MPTLFVFLFKVNIALLLFCAGYYLVLRHLTFYSLNRVYLVTAIIFATLYPKIDLSGFAQKHEALTRPVQNVALVWQAPAQKLATHPNYWQWAEYVFWAGAILLAMRLAVQLLSLLKLYRSSKPAHIHNHDVRLMDGDAAPFSFWQSIYVNPANHTPADLEAILLHEQVHVNGWHTIDILLAELSSIFYWFNPGIWLMKKAVRENIEFITDRKILNKGFDSKTYQYSLVNVSFNNTTPGIVNHFNISTIKKRIIMMNAKRSSRFNLTRYAFVVPAVVALLLVFTLSKAEVTKPISIKISNAIKPVTIAIKEAANTAITNTQTAIKETKAAINAVKRDTILKNTFSFASIINEKPAGVKLKADSVFLSFAYNKPDTGKKMTLFLRTNDGKNGVDSMNFVLNGKKISSAEFKNIDPNKISAVNIVSQDAIDGLIGPDNDLNFDNNRNVLFITTSDSEAGKKLMERFSKRRQITGIRINGVNRPEGTVTDADFAMASSLSGLTGAINGQQLATVRDIKGNKALKEVVVRGYQSKPDLNEVTVNGYGNKLYTIDSAITVTGYASGKLATTNRLRLSGEPAKTVVIRDYPSGGNRVYLREPAGSINGTGIYVETIDRETGAVVTPVAMSNKLYIIDGKEASEKAMKKLSAFDIDRINVSKNTDVIKQYGDKAKNGVIFIYTKKLKK